MFRVQSPLARPVSAPKEFAVYTDKIHKAWEKKGSLLSYLLVKGTEEAQKL